MQHTILCENGPEVLLATEPTPGLRIYEVPESVSVGDPNRWSLGTHDGYQIASFTTELAAGRAAEDLTGLADWTAPFDEIRALGLKHKATSLRFRQLLWDAITTHGGQISNLGTRPA